MARFGSRLWGLAKTLVVALLVLAAIVAGAVAFGVLDDPEVVGIESHFGEVDRSTTLVDSDVIVANPNPIGVRLGDATVGHTVEMNGVRMGTGTKEGIELQRGRTTVPVTTRIANDRIPEWWASHVRNGERTRVTTTATVESSVPLVGSVEITENRTFETDVLSRFNSTQPREISTGIALLPDPLLVVDRTAASWGAVSTNRTALDIAIGVRNPNDLAVPISRLDYNVSMNNVTVANGTTQPDVIPANGETTVETTARLRNDRLDEWWVSHLERDQTTTVEVAFVAVIELPSGETVRLPLDALTYTEELSTDIFGTDGS